MVTGPQGSPFGRPAWDGGQRVHGASLTGALLR